LTQPQSKEQIELLAKAKSAGQIFAVTHNEHLNSKDLFKSCAVEERKKLADGMMKDKRLHFERGKLRQRALDILKEQGEPTEENIKTYPAKAMKKLYSINGSTINNLLRDAKSCLKPIFEPLCH